MKTETPPATLNPAVKAVYFYYLSFIDSFRSAPMPPPGASLHVEIQPSVGKHLYVCPANCVDYQPSGTPGGMRLLVNVLPKPTVAADPLPRIGKVFAM